VWQCAVTLSGDVRVEFWDHDRFSDVSANYYTLVCLCISVQGSAQSGGPNWCAVCYIRKFVCSIRVYYKCISNIYKNCTGHWIWDILNQYEQNPECGTGNVTGWAKTGCFFFLISFFCFSQSAVYGIDNWNNNKFDMYSNNVAIKEVQTLNPWYETSCEDRYLLINSLRYSTFKCRQPFLSVVHPHNLCTFWYKYFLILHEQQDM